MQAREKLIIVVLIINTVVSFMYHDVVSDLVSGFRVSIVG